MTRHGVPVADLVPHRSRESADKPTLGELQAEFSALPQMDVAGWYDERRADDEIFGPDDPLTDEWRLRGLRVGSGVSGAVRVLLDTSVLIDLAVVDLGEHRDARGALSAVTIAELSYGRDVDDPVERLARSSRLERAVAQFDVLSFDLNAARVYGTLAALVRRSGRNPRPRRLDLQIAATATAHSLTDVARSATTDEHASTSRLYAVRNSGRPEFGQRSASTR